MPLDTLIQQRFGVRTSPVLNPANTSIGSSALSIAPNNPDRLGLIVINLSTNVVYLSPDGAPSSTRGIRLSPSGGAIALTWDEDFHMVGWEWFAVASGAASAIFVLSIEEY